MEDQNKINQIKEEIENFFGKMTISSPQIEVDIGGIDNKGESSAEVKGVINLNIHLQEPQVLIGQQGQTLFELQRILKIILNKKLQENYYLSLDINDYKKNKVEYLEKLAQSAADEASMMKKEKELPAMSSYERRIIHAKLSERDDIMTESQGEGQDRHLIIKPK